MAGTIRPTPKSYLVHPFEENQHEREGCQAVLVAELQEEVLLHTHQILQLRDDSPSDYSNCDNPLDSV
jgi:hypothetical protein